MMMLIYILGGYNGDIDNLYPGVYRLEMGTGRSLRFRPVASFRPLTFVALAAKANPASLAPRSEGIFSTGHLSKAGFQV